MARDFEERKLVYNDYTSLDTSPIGQAQRATWTEARLAVELKRQKAESLDFLNTQYRKVKKARYNEEFQDTAPRVYRTASRRTTRPNLSGDAAEAAVIFNEQDWRQYSYLNRLQTGPSAVKKPCALCPRLPPEPIAMPGPKFLRPFIELTYFLIK